MQTERAIAFILQELRTGLSEDLSYHNIQHTVEIIAAAGKLGQMEGINGKKLDLLLTAAAFHDAGFLKTYDGHEVVSCELAWEYLPKYDYTNEEIEQICSMIMATEASIVPDSLLAEILCDADLDYLGREDYFQISDRLRVEWARRDHIFSQREWLELQVSFLGKHHYYTNSAKEIRDKGKELNLNALKRRLSHIGK